MATLCLPTPPGPPAAWLGLLALIPVALMVELGLGNRDRAQQGPTTGQATVRVVLWVAAALAFALALWAGGDAAGRQAAQHFLACYLLKLSLSADNLFVFLLLLERAEISRRASHRLLMWGLLGALVMRAGFVAAGSGLIVKFHRLVYVLGAFLLLTAIRLLMEHGEHRNEPQVASWPTRLWRSLVPQASSAAFDRAPEAFFVWEHGRWAATPLVAVLIAIETADIVFAVDSVPAAFGVTTDLWVVMAANACALLGLRSLFFVLGGWLARLRYLRVALSVILALVGLKMLIGGIFEVPTWATLAAIVTVLGTAIVASRLDRA